MQTDIMMIVIIVGVRQELTWDWSGAYVSVESLANDNYHDLRWPSKRQLIYLNIHFGGEHGKRKPNLQTDLLRRHPWEGVEKLNNGTWTVHSTNMAIWCWT